MTTKKNSKKKSDSVESKSPGTNGQPMAFQVSDINAQLKQLPDVDEKVRSLLTLNQPHLWFPVTRQLKREITCHVGSVHSKRFDSALQEFWEAKTAVYCTPSKLMAWNVYNMTNEEGIPCELVTLQERKSAFSPSQGGNPPENAHVSKKAQHISATIEMLDLEQEYDVVVIDQIHKMDDQERGWLLTHALLGARARKIHVVGDIIAVPLVRKLMDMTNDTVEVKISSSPEKINIEREAVKVTKLRRGDCLIAFRRKELYNLMEKIGKTTGLKVGVLYDDLPLSVQIEQMERFNNPNHPKRIDVLIATDTIVMAPILNLSRVVLTSVSKPHGNSSRKLTIQETKEIIGLAGRSTDPDRPGKIAFLGFDASSVLLSYTAMESPWLRMAAVQPPFERLTQLVEALAPLAERLDKKALVLPTTAEAPPKTGTSAPKPRTTRSTAKNTALNAGRKRGRRSVDYRESPQVSPPSQASGTKTEEEGTQSPENTSGPIALPPLEFDPFSEETPDEFATLVAYYPKILDCGFNQWFYKQFGEYDWTGHDSLDKRHHKTCQLLLSYLRGGKKKDEHRETYLRLTSLADRVSSVIKLSEMMKLFSVNRGMEENKGWLLSGWEKAITIAEWLEKGRIKLPLRTVYTLLQAPITTCEELCRDAFIAYVQRMAAGKIVHHGVWFRKDTPESPYEVAKREAMRTVLYLYLWLSRQFPKHFPWAKEAEDLLVVLEKKISSGVGHLRRDNAMSYVARKGIHLRWLRSGMRDAFGHPVTRHWISSNDQLKMAAELYSHIVDDNCFNEWKGKATSGSNSSRMDPFYRPHFKYFGDDDFLLRDTDEAHPMPNNALIPPMADFANDRGGAEDLDLELASLERERRSTP